jgi:mannose-6-phosphate isomerase-like protein (cupin superfamily)
MTQTPDPGMHKRTFTEPDESRPAGRGRGDVVTLNQMTFARLTLEPGWRWSDDVKPITKTESCQTVHTGVVVSGRLHVIMDNGTEEEFTAGDAYHFPAGHDAWVVGDEPFVGIDVTGPFTWAQPA